jgi:hypothetical protein
MITHAGHLPQVPSREATAAERAATLRAADRAARRAFRSRRTVPALIAALLLTAAGTFTAIEAIARPATSWAWNDWPVLATGASLTFLGLLFLLAGLLPGRSRIVPLHADTPDVVFGVTRHGLRQTLAATADNVEGVARVRTVKLRRHRVRIGIDTARHAPEGVHERVRAAVRHRLDAIQPLPLRGVTVRVHHREGREGR